MRKKAVQFTVSNQVIEYAVLFGVEGIDWIELKETYSQYYMN